MLVGNTVSPDRPGLSRPLFFRLHVDNRRMTHQEAVFAKLVQFNRPYMVDCQVGDFLFQLYRLLWDAGISDWAKQRAFEAAADCKHSWRVVCISEAALKKIVLLGTGEDLQRAHGFARKDRFLKLFKSAPLTQGELLECFFRYDTCALVTSQENNKKGVGDWSPLLAVPEGILTSRGFSIRVRKKIDLPWAKNELSNLQGLNVDHCPNRQSQPTKQNAPNITV